MTSRIRNAFFSLALLVGSLAAPAAEAGFFDFSFGFNFTKNTYANDSYSWTRRYGPGLGYHFNETSTLEVSLQDNYERNHFTGFEDSTYHDRIYSVNWVQGLTGKEAILQPYLKGGFGFLEHSATSVNGYNQSQSTRLLQETVVAGAGLRVKITQTIGLRAEGTSYLTDIQLRSFKKNFAATFGVSVYF